MKPSRIVSSSSSPNAPYLSYHPRQKENATSRHVLAHEFQIAVVGALGIAAEALFLRNLGFSRLLLVSMSCTSEEGQFQNIRERREKTPCYDMLWLLRP